MILIGLIACVIWWEVLASTLTLYSDSSSFSITHNKSVSPAPLIISTFLFSLNNSKIGLRLFSKLLPSLVPYFDWYTISFMISTTSFLLFCVGITIDMYFNGSNSYKSLIHSSLDKQSACDNGVSKALYLSNKSFTFINIFGLIWTYPEYDFLDAYASVLKVFPFPCLKENNFPSLWNGSDTISKHPNPEKILKK